MGESQKHTYDYPIDTSSETAPAKVIGMVGSGKRVLEIGCGPGSITRILARDAGCTVTGLELDPVAIRIVAPFCDQVIQADLNSPNWPNLVGGAGTYDVVVAADVLEHLYDPLKTLQRMVHLINPDGYFVISLPHAGHAAIMSCLACGDFAYGKWGLLDSTHIRFFGFKNIEDLFAHAGLKIIEARYVVMHPEDTELCDQWSRITPILKTALLRIRHAEVYQVVIKAVPVDRAGDSLPLIPPKRHIILSNIKRGVAKRLSPRMRGRIRELFAMMGIKL